GGGAAGRIGGGVVWRPGGARYRLRGGAVGVQPRVVVLPGRAARRGAGTEIVAGKSVLQAPDGTVRAVLANRDAGVLDFAAVRMAP
ncbi:hypothetical protein WLU63_25200, partial [Bordetella bronchiseptica]